MLTAKKIIKEIGILTSTYTGVRDTNTLFTIMAKKVMTWFGWITLFTLTDLITCH